MQHEINQLVDAAIDRHVSRQERRHARKAALDEEVWIAYGGMLDDNTAVSLQSPPQRATE